jgi:hypothetical protein
MRRGRSEAFVNGRADDFDQFVGVNLDSAVLRDVHLVMCAALDVFDLASERVVQRGARR